MFSLARGGVLDGSLHLGAPRSAREDLKVEGAQPSALPAVL